MDSGLKWVGIELDEPYGKYGGSVNGMSWCFNGFSVRFYNFRVKSLKAEVEKGSTDIVKRGNANELGDSFFSL